MSAEGRGLGEDAVAAFERARGISLPVPCRSFVAQIADGAVGPALPRIVYRTRAWSTSATRTVKVVVVGTAGRPRVDDDAFLVMR